MTAYPNFKKERIVSISLSVVSPQYIGPESLTLNYDFEKKNGSAEYTGFKVQVPGPFGKDVVSSVSKPWKKEITLEEFKSAAELFENNTKWFAEETSELKNKPNFRMGGEVYQIKIVLRNILSNKDQRGLVIKSGYFDSNVPLPEEFLSIINTISRKYLNKDITKIAEYD